MIEQAVFYAPISMTQPININDLAKFEKARFVLSCLPEDKLRAHEQEVRSIIYDYLEGK